MNFFYRVIILKNHESNLLNLIISDLIRNLIRKTYLQFH